MQDLHSKKLKSMLEDRFALRMHDDVKTALDRWWGAAMHSLERVPNPSGRRNSLTAKSRIYFTQYSAVLLKAAKAMTPTAEFDEAAAAKKMDEEAQRDCGGRDFLEAEEFKDGMCAQRDASLLRRDPAPPRALIAPHQCTLCASRAWRALFPAQL